MAQRKPISLALQGGGSWGAYTWGVLDVLLASRTVSIERLSGTSAGALNAAIVASALVHGNASHARAQLRSFWQAVAQPAIADLGREVWGPVERSWRDAVDVWLTAGGWSPYDVNPLGMNPLRDIIAAHVDIDAMRSSAALPLHVTITNVRTGLPRVVDNDAITLDVLLASACLPQLFQAVEIDGEPYWDGGYSGNPTLWPMIEARGTRDLLVVQLTPDRAVAVPTDGAAIRRRVNEIVFNASLVAQLRSIARLRRMANEASPVRALRLHRIGPPGHDLLREGSPLERSRAWIDGLYADGRRGARRFLARHGAELGVRETLDVEAMFSDAGAMPARPPADEVKSARSAGVERAVLQCSKMVH
jgi:NTE family protein